VKAREMSIAVRIIFFIVFLLLLNPS